MATLQKIRNQGPLLLIVIGLALFAFIATDAWRALEPHQMDQNVGEINGKEISAQEYQTMVEEYTKVQELIYGQNINDEALTQARDYVWNTYVRYKLIEKEALAAGIKVTDAEIKSLIKEGVHPILSTTPFVNPQTRQFDKNIMDSFIQYGNPDEVSLIMNYTEKKLKEELLISKFYNLLMKSAISNPVEAEYAFNARNNQSDILLAVLPYSSVADSTISISSSDIKDLYNEKKEQYRNFAETRDIKYIDVQIVPSEADRTAVANDVTEFSNELASVTEGLASFIRSTGSKVPYVDMHFTKGAFPSDIAVRLDSVAVGEVYGPFYSQNDDSYNAFKVISKQVAPDSIQFRQIQVIAETPAATKALADSISTAIKGGADFVEIAQKYGQTGESVKIASNNYESFQMDSNTQKLLNALNSLAPKQTANIEIAQGVVICQVVDKKNMVNKYKVAVVKCPVEFSKETYSKTYNDLSQFVAANQTLESLEKNAEENGYRVLSMNAFTTRANSVANIKDTREAQRWIFEAEEGEISPLYDCGQNRDHLLVVAVSDINEEGYLPAEKVASALRAEVLRNKKAELLSEKLKGANSFEAIKGIENVLTDTVKHISFSAPTYVSLTYSSEPALGGKVANAELNKLNAPIKGNGGVYVLQVYGTEKTNDTFDSETEQANKANMNMRFLSNFLLDLEMKGEVKDTRFRFF